MDWIIPAIVGWCGTGWPFKWWPRPGGGGVDPDWPWPPNCWVCWGILGSLSAVILDPIVSPLIVDQGLGVRIALSFFAGGFGSTLLGGAYGMMRGNKGQ